MARFTTQRCASLVAGMALLAASGCFDSDETFTPRAGTTTTGDPDPTTGDAESSSSGGPDGTTGEPEFTCRDAIACINACALDLAINPSVEPDLGCLLDCIEDNLTVRETYNVLQLSNCVADVCEQREACMPDDSGTGGDTDAGDGGGGDDGGGLIDPCLQCIFTELSNDEPEECIEFHEICDAMDEE